MGSVTTIGCLASTASASIQIFYNKAAWEQAVGGTGAFTTIDFVQPAPMIITNQYANLGVIFTEGDDSVGQSLSGPTNDGWALVSGNATVNMLFTAPRTYFAVEKPGLFDFTVHAGDQQLVYLGGAPTFIGFISTIPFDRIFCFDGVQIDNIYFGGVPTPGAIGLFAVSALVGRGRRRR